ncbi:hypothetical protein ACFLXN_02385 [Chloroflexota bacterium]
MEVGKVILEAHVMGEKDDFKTLLTYYVDHSKDHAGEFVEMADKARAIGEAAIADAIMKGVEQTNKATELFEAALKLCD